MNNLSIHGGEEFRNNSTLNPNSIENSKDNNKNKINCEMNLLDKVVSKNMLWSKNKLNDVHENELKNNSKDDKREPTPVTLANI